jgi:hypothetical protein
MSDANSDSNRLGGTAIAATLGFQGFVIMIATYEYDAPALHFNPGRKWAML